MKKKTEKSCGKSRGRVGVYIARDIPAMVWFIASLMAIAYLYGAISCSRYLFPYDVLQQAKEAFIQLREPRHFLHVARYEESGVTVNRQPDDSDGVTLLTGFWDEESWLPEARLIDMNGNVLHTWKVPSDQLWGDSKFNYIHGSYLFPNGDLLVNIEYQGLARLDPCGRLLWKSEFPTHHSVFRDEEGNFWVPGQRHISQDSDRTSLFHGINPSFKEDLILKVSPDGDLLSEISVLESLFSSGYGYLLRKFSSKTGDLTHLNDIEILSGDMATDFPLFKEGDILISLRNINTVLVMSPKGEIKWIDSTYVLRQHDPDFEPGGKITIFDNRDDGTEDGSILGGSRIIAIDPITHVSTTKVGVRGETQFYTRKAGKHQLLENGNRLITETRGGRVFEVDPDGKIIWEWIQRRVEKKYVSEVMEGTRYEFSKSVISSWECS